jgi:hypothetical protein
MLASVDYKGLGPNLSSLDATLTENQGGGLINTAAHKNHFCTVPKGNLDGE